MLFVLVFLMGTTGLGLLVGGPLSIRGKKIPLRTARQIGISFIGLFPALLLIRFIIHQVDAEGGAYVDAVNWSLALATLLVGAFLFWRVMRPASAPRSAM